MKISEVFRCPECDESRLEEIVTQATIVNRVIELDPKYPDEPFVEMSDICDGVTERFQCAYCGYILYDKDGDLINNFDDLIEWLDEHKPIEE